MSGTTSIGQRSLCRLSRLYHHHRIHDKNLLYLYANAQSHDQFHRAIITTSTRRFHYSVPNSGSSLFRSSSFQQHFQYTLVRPLAFQELLRVSPTYYQSQKSICFHRISSGNKKVKVYCLLSHPTPIIITSARNMSSKHLATGAPCPPLKDGVTRIYSMRYCPFAQRALLAAEAKGVKYEIVNCNLHDKPEFLIERNPEGLVPVLETTDGKVISESLIVAEYLDDAFPQQKPLFSSDPYKKALDKLFIHKFGSITSKFYSILFGLRASSQDSEDVTKEKLQKLVDGLKDFEKELARRGTAYFAGENPGMLDYMIWPWFERLGIFKLKFPNLFDYEAAKQQSPALENWRQNMKKDATVSKLLISPEEHLKFAENYLSGNPVYD